MIVLNDDTSSYYSWFLRKRFGLHLNPPIRGSHLTVVNDRIQGNEDMEKYVKGKELWHGKDIEFTYDSDVRTDEVSWWLPVKSEMSIQVRNDCGLGKAFYGFHLTIGRADHPLMIEHSKYVLSSILKYGI